MAAQTLMRRLRLLGLLFMILSPATALTHIHTLEFVLPYLGAAMIVVGCADGKSLRMLRTLSVGLTEVGLVSLLFEALKVDTLPIGLEGAFWLTFAALTANTALSILTRPRSEDH
ncbi:MAG: hypothetical protein QW767_04730 [Thermoprotei archaeon]